MRVEVLREELEGRGLSVAVATELVDRSREAHAALPSATVSEDDWATRLVGVCPDEASLAGLRVDDLWLATLLDANDTAALKEFEAVLMPAVEVVLRRFETDEDARDELRQLVRVRLLVGTATTSAKIGQFEGRGRLVAWVRTVAARVALNEKRGDREYDDPAVLDALGLGTMPEFRLLRAEGQAQFWSCLRSAFSSLPSRSRAVLRLRYRGGMTAAAIGRAYRVHESTVSRWLASARESLVRAFDDAAGKSDDAVSASDLRRVLSSRFELSLSGLFSTASTPEAS